MENLVYSHDFVDAFQKLRVGAKDQSPVSGLTHQHYKYPARFSPSFVASAIDVFSKPNDLVLDPYMGGGTTIIEALASKRRVIGCDVNSLAVFVAKAKTTVLSDAEADAVEVWALATVGMKYHDDPSGIEEIVCPVRTRNLQLPRARYIKKIISFGLALCEELPTENARIIARCSLLSVSQWALNGRKNSPTLDEFRRKLISRTFETLQATNDLAIKLKDNRFSASDLMLIHDSAEYLPNHLDSSNSTKVDLVVTSPPYPGVHILYHRWQVDGRRETPAPYWIAGCLDGEGSGYYNFGGRAKKTLDDYFSASLITLKAIRRVMREGAIIVQMIAFSDPRRQLIRYLENMKLAGFDELDASSYGTKRIWRQVPNRNWHAETKGATNSSREVVLIHAAI